MPFQYGVNSAVYATGVTPDKIHQSMFRVMANAGVVDPSRVWPVLDDEAAPPEHPPDDRFVTVRYPSFVWDQGDVASGDRDDVTLSKLMCTGQSRHTLWLQSDRDLYGTADSLVEDAMAAGPAGGQLIGPMVAAFFEKYLLDEDGLNSISSKPLRFVSLELPEGAGSSSHKPFRITWEVSFVWDLSAGG